jgi:hypothetical protein
MNRKEWIDALPARLGEAKHILGVLCMETKRIDDEDVNRAVNLIGKAMDTIDDAAEAVEVEIE